MLWEVELYPEESTYHEQICAKAKHNFFLPSEREKFFRLFHPAIVFPMKD
jgi:hypothetical protein